MKRSPTPALEAPDGQVLPSTSSALEEEIMVTVSRLLVFFAGALIAFHSHSAVIATFTPLGFLPGGQFPESAALGVSANGNVVVGFSSSENAFALNAQEAFRWQANTGLVGLGSLGGAPFFSRAQAVSGNGQVVVGVSISPQGEEAFRWSAQTGMVGLGDLPGLGFNSRATGVSHNGLVIVGMGLGQEEFRAFRWTRSTGMVDLGELPGGIPFSNAQAVSADGNIVVGYAYSAAGKEAFRWTLDGGMQSLGDLAGGAVESYAYGISANGQVIVGMGLSDTGYEAFRWTAVGGLQSLGAPPGASLTAAYSTTSNGDVVLGSYSTVGVGERAFIWDANNGMRDLYDVLVNDFGLQDQLIGWQLAGARVSAHGRTFAGYGIFQGQRQAWVVDIRGAVSEPGSLALTLVGLTVLMLVTRLGT
jgi:probable HAF family extracellular repeat protein